jgi:hypothetical protein
LLDPRTRVFEAGDERFERIVALWLQRRIPTSRS